MMRFLLLFCLICYNMVSQNGGIVTSGSVSASGFISSEEQLPFWFFTNTSNTISGASDGALTATVRSVYDFNNSTVFAGLSGALRNGFDDEFQRIDLHIGYRNNWIEATLGPKRQEQVLNGLSATNKNFLWSGNNRPLPGILIKAPRWMKITNDLSLDWGIGHYVMNDDRFVPDTWVHFKDLTLKWDINESNSLLFKIQHVAQWGGNSPIFGEQPNDLEAFFDVFLAKRGGDEATAGDQINAVGNHLGSYLLEYELSQASGDFIFYHEHPFEDGSGTRLANFPDGVWGVSFAPVNKKLFSRVLYEFITTKDQSGSGSGTGFDRYFSNKLYRTGWAYEETIIGFPFFVFDPNVIITEDTTPIVSDLVQLHHFAANGGFGNFAWLFKSSISNNQGTLRERFSMKLKNWYNYLSLSYNTTAYGAFTVVLGADFSNLAEDNFGAGLSYTFTF
jgi:hypothetical protein